jgi:hypothetical protein
MVENIISIFRIFTRLYGIISQKRELIITAVRTAVPTILYNDIRLRGKTKSNKTDSCNRE